MEKGSALSGDARRVVERHSCRVCSGSVEFSLAAREMFHGTRDAFDYETCSVCGCLQIREVPEDLGRYYPDDYYTHLPQAIVKKNPKAASPLRRAWTKTRLAGGWALRPFAGRRFGRFAWFTRTHIDENAAILDVGCGSGRLLWRMHHEGFRNLTGIDPDWTSSIAAPDVGPRCRRDSLETHIGQYRLVMSHHSFEHVADPRAAFRAFARLVDRGGWLLLRIPLAGSWAQARYGADWVQLDAPRHLHLHTRASIARLAEASGFRVAHVSDDSGPFQIWGSELYRRNIALVECGRGGRPHINSLARARAWVTSRWLRIRGQGDQACFYLQKTASLKPTP